MVQCSTVGCSVAQKGAAKLSRMQRCSLECSVAQSTVAHTMQLRREQVAQEGTAYLSKVQCSLIGFSS
jgi:hypothetical protein